MALESNTVNDQLRCDRCGKTDNIFREEIFRNGTKNIARICAFCNNKINWAVSSKAPFVFYFGKHKGLNIEDVYAKDPSYLNWCVENMESSNITRKIKAFLEEKKKRIATAVVQGKELDEEWIRRINDGK